MLIGDIFERSVTRPIPPVVYFHEQGSVELEREVQEYIITGGYPAGHPRASAEGIHEQFVKLLTNIRTELDKDGGTELPACWISGFYGSGKSSFTKLLGLALDRRTLPDGRLLGDALLAQDRSPSAHELGKAWGTLTGNLDAMAVVFDVGSKVRDGEHVHSVVVREVQLRLDYCSTSQLVAEYELKLEMEGLYSALEAKTLSLHGKPWDELKHSMLAEDYFSASLHALKPDLYPDAMAWVNARSGSAFDGVHAADDAVVALQRMMNRRAKDKTLFLAIDEVSQFVHDDEKRIQALQAFVSALGQRMRGTAWILATGQQKLEDGAGFGASIMKLKARFPPQLRVHLGNSNIREVVYQRLLRKKKTVEEELQALFHRHRPEIAIHAYQGERISESEFVEMYPLLPGHIDLLLRITTGLRARGTRVQGDAHEIRGLLQLLGDIFRDQDLVRREPGWLLTIDRVYDVLHTALDVDLHMTLNRALEHAQRLNDHVMTRVVKAVAMLELVQDEKHPSTAELVASCLYAKLGDGNPLPDVQKALDALVREGLVGNSGKTGYRIESSAGQEWQRRRDAYVPSSEQISEQVRKVLADLIADHDRVEVAGLPLAWLVFYSDNVGTKDARLRDERKPTAVTVDFQLTKGEGRDEWVPRSATPAYRERVVWVVGDQDALRHAGVKLVRSLKIIDSYSGKTTNDPDTERLLRQERNDEDASRRELVEAVKSAFMAGNIYFGGEHTEARAERAATFLPTLTSFATRAAKRLYPNPVGYSVTEKDITFLLESKDLAAPPPVLCDDKLGILSLDAGRYEVTCKGAVPQEILKLARAENAISGAQLVTRLGGPPHGVPPDVTRAAVVGLLRAGKIRIEIQGIAELTSVRDEGARELLKDGGLKKAHITENTSETLPPRDRNAICQLFKEQLGREVARENEAIADAVVAGFTQVRTRLTEIGQRFRRLPRNTAYPEALDKLEAALVSCAANVRRTEATVLAVKRALPALRDGLPLLRRMEVELTEEAIAAVTTAFDVVTYEWPGLLALGPTDAARAAAHAITAHVTEPRPWEDVAELAKNAKLVRDEFRERRQQVLVQHDADVEAALDRLKRREGFDRLDADQRFKVTQHLREGAAANTDEKAIAPPLEALESHLAVRRANAENKALQQLDSLRESTGGRPVVEVSLALAGREIESEAELERLLDDLRERIRHELAANHKVRLRNV